MVSWIIVSVALLLSVMWGALFFRQWRSGLTATALDDKFTWGLYVQGFFYFSALAGGALMFIAVASLFEVRSLRPLIERGAAVSFSCLVAAALLLGSDLGKPFRGMKILTGNNLASPLTWDFYTLAVCAFLNLVFLLGLIPAQGALTAVWSVLCLVAVLGYVMTHTLLFLSRVGAGFKSQPFLGLDALAQSLWGGTALTYLISLGSGFSVPVMAHLLLALTVLAIMPLIGSHIASMTSKHRTLDQKKIIGLDAGILIFLLLIRILAPEQPALLAIASIAILVAVFLEKVHLVRQYQTKPNLPLPYSRYEEVSEYAPTANEWLLTLGSVGVCVLLSSIILYLRTIITG